MDPKEVFEALPHINKIWVTEDGHFHLHPHNGGTLVLREDVENEGNDEGNDEGSAPTNEDIRETLKAEEEKMANQVEEIKNPEEDLKPRLQKAAKK
jgi:hypothetical protein